MIYAILALLVASHLPGHGAPPVFDAFTIIRPLAYTVRDPNGLPKVPVTRPYCEFPRMDTAQFDCALEDRI